MNFINISWRFKKIFKDRKLIKNFKKIVGRKYNFYL